MNFKLNDIYDKLNAGTKEATIAWFEASSRSGFITATSKGSIKLERSDFSDEYSLKFLDNNGILLEEIEIKKDDDAYSSFKDLFDIIRKKIYNVDKKVGDILSELGKQQNFLQMENIFPGKWKNDYKFPNNNSGNEIFEIRKGKYLIRDIAVFNVEDFFTKQDNSEISFLKVGLMGDQRRLRNVLRVIELGREYEGTETDEMDKSTPRTVKYGRVE